MFTLVRAVKDQFYPATQQWEHVMRTLLVGYDLNDPNQDYAKLGNFLKELSQKHKPRVDEGEKTWWHELDSTWLIRADLSAGELQAKLGDQVADNDEVLVIDITGRSAAWQGFKTEASEWLTKHL